MSDQARPETNAEADRLVVHMVGNAHIDPVWLWGWQAGVDEALASFRSAADRCDEYPEFVYTRGEAWLYRQVETLDSRLFERVRGLIGRGQWHVSGGQFLQPDVNGPTLSGLRRQVMHGRKYFESRFGVTSDVGYNLDSFGHPATLPDVLAELGYRAYCFHRPKPDQLELPGQAFRWRGSGGGEVTAFRIVPGYTTLGEDLGAQIETALKHADPALGHTMCFYGVGNHGGGPTKSDIEFVLENRFAYPGVELRFSTPAAFFDAVAPHHERLPVVTQELQRCFPGCYSVMHDVKRAQRHGELLLDQAERSVRVFAGPERAEKLTGNLDAAWEDLLFTEFHDILAGTSIPSAWGSVRAMQGRARILGEEAIVESSRSWAVRELPPVNHQQLVVINPDDHDREELVEVEPWLDMDAWGARWVSDMDGTSVDYQRLQPEAPQITTRLLLPVRVPARSALQLLLRDDAPPGRREMDTDLTVSEDGIANGAVRVETSKKGIVSLKVNGQELLGEGGLSLHLRHDHTDTWTFHTDRWSEDVSERLELDGWEVEERGPLRARLRAEGRLGTSRLRWTLDLVRGEPRLGMGLEVNFDERHKLLQMPLSLAEPVTRWGAGLAGGHVEREASDIEWPAHGWAALPGVGLAFLTHDAYSLSVDGRSAQWTLLRSPRMAWGGGESKPYSGRNWYTDQGVHQFDFQLLFGELPAPEELSRRADRLAQPLLAFDRYDGMDRPLGRRKSSEPVQALFRQE